MPVVAKTKLLQIIVDAFGDAGWNAIVVQRNHPFVLRVFRDAEVYTVRVYIWALTHGGGARRPANEYRIQVTGIDRSTGFEAQGADRVLLLGWWPRQKVFAGFDVSRHAGPLGASPSIQIQEETLRGAVLDGMATQKKGSGEIAVAFSPTMLPEYVRNLESLHDFGRSDDDLQALENTIEDPDAVNDQQLNAVDAGRRVVIQEVARALRDRGFRDRVLAAYGSCCAFCELQLKLVDAAHIVPVQSSGNDATENGLALCALHHRAFDRALLTLNEQYQVILSQAKMRELQKLGFDGGADEFERGLRDIIHVPPARSDRPNRKLIRRANKLRGWIN